VLSLAVITTGAASLTPATGGTGAVVIFRPDVAPSQAFAAVAAAGGIVSDVSPSGRSMIVAMPGNAARWVLYRQGALIVGGGALAGCASGR
jgi:hypothetical protein